jgi:hypothetical protein
MTRLSSWTIFLSLILATLLTACAGDPTPPPPVGFEITADYQTNNSRLFYFVARTANDKQFMLESYQDVANKAFSDPQDTSVLGVFSIVPGTKQKYSVSLPAQGTVALYFLFTQPGTQWKKLLSVPLKDKYNINLTPTSQVEIIEDKSWF